MMRTSSLALRAKEQPQVESKLEEVSWLALHFGKIAMAEP